MPDWEERKWPMNSTTSPSICRRIQPVESDQSGNLGRHLDALRLKGMTRSSLPGDLHAEEVHEHLAVGRFLLVLLWAANVEVDLLRGRVYFSTR